MYGLRSWGVNVTLINEAVVNNENVDISIDPGNEVVVKAAKEDSHDDPKNAAPTTKGQERAVKVQNEADSSDESSEDERRISSTL